MPGISHLERQNGINNNTPEKEWKYFGGKESVLLLFSLYPSLLFIWKEGINYAMKETSTLTQ